MAFTRRGFILTAGAAGIIAAAMPVKPSVPAPMIDEAEDAPFFNSGPSELPAWVRDPKQHVAVTTHFPYADNFKNNLVLNVEDLNREYVKRRNNPRIETLLHRY